MRGMQFLYSVACIQFDVKIVLSLGGDGGFSVRFSAFAMISWDLEVALLVMYTFA